MEQLYRYAGYDEVHSYTGLKNYYNDTKENIMSYLRSSSEFIEGTSEEEKEKHLEDWFNCYTTAL